MMMTVIIMVIRMMIRKMTSHEDGDEHDNDDIHNLKINFLTPPHTHTQDV